jgi:hypothetical protein
MLGAALENTDDRRAIPPVAFPPDAPVVMTVNNADIKRMKVNSLDKNARVSVFT